MDKTDIPLRILLVEDSEHDILSLHRILKKAAPDWKVTDITRAEDALEKIRSEPSSFDIIVADHTLPGMTGLQLCQTLIAEKTNLPLVLLTGTGSEEIAVEALKAGVDDYITKGNGSQMETVPYVLKEVMKRHDEKLGREEAEKALHSERSLFIAGPVVVFKWRNEEGWPVEYVTPNVCDVLGYTPEEFLSGEVAYSAIINNKDIDRVAEEVATNSAADTNSFTHDPYRIVTKNGSSAWLQDYTMILRDEEGKPTHYLGYIINITDRIMAKEELRKAYDELAQKTERLERFQKIAVDRELEMIKLKGEVNGLLERLGEQGKYRANGKSKEE